jgi:hypothetical protein
MRAGRNPRAGGNIADFDGSWPQKSAMFALSGASHSPFPSPIREAYPAPTTQAIQDTLRGSATPVRPGRPGR